MSIATSRKVKGADGSYSEEETEWHRVCLFGRQAELAQEYLHKGSQVYIEGRLHTRKYTGKDGIERYATDIMGEHLQFLDRRNSDGQQSDGGFESAPRPAESPRSEDVPF